MWSPPSPSTGCAGNQRVLPGAAHSSQCVLVGLQFQAAVAQEWFCSCSPLPGLPKAACQTGAVAAFTCWPGEPQACLCAEAAVPGKFGSQGTALPKHWGFPAAVEHSSPGAQESCQLLQPPQQVPAEGLNMEPRQPGLALPTRKISTESFTCATLCVSAWGCTGVMDWKKIAVPNPVQKVSFGFFFHFFPSILV